MSKIYYLGIDPGTNGGIAAIDSDNKVYLLSRMPDTLEKLHSILSMFKHLETYVMLEQVSGYIGEEHPGSRMFEFGRGYGAIEMGIVSLGFTHRDQAAYKNNRYRVGGEVGGSEWEHILPQRWQRGLSLRTKEKGESDTMWKNYLKEEAAKLFPRIKVTNSTADALLISHYCKVIREKK